MVREHGGVGGCRASGVWARRGPLYKGLLIGGCFFEGRDPLAQSTLDEWALYDGPTGWDQRPAIREAERACLYLLGGRDPGVPLALNLDEAEALRAHGADVTVLSYPLGEHLLPLVSYWFDIEEWPADVTSSP